MTRKTIEVGKVLKMANNFLAAENTNEDEREAICSFIETVLFESGNYKGYAYLELKQDADGNVETLGSGSRRRYMVADEIWDDYHAESRDVNVIRV